MQIMHGLLEKSISTIIDNKRIITKTEEYKAITNKVVNGFAIGEASVKNDKLVIPIRIKNSDKITLLYCFRCNLQ